MVSSFLSILAFTLFFCLHVRGVFWAAAGENGRYLTVWISLSCILEIEESVRVSEYRCCGWKSLIGMHGIALRVHCRMSLFS